MNENFASMYSELVLPQAPIHNLTYMGAYKKNVLNVYYCNEEEFLGKQWPLLWKIMKAVNTNITPLAYSDLATLNMKSNKNKSLSKILELMQPSRCIVWGIKEDPEFSSYPIHEVKEIDSGLLLFANDLNSYEQPDEKKKLWESITTLFKTT